VLEVAEQIGVDIPFVCRVGVCGTCKIKLVSGEVFMEVQEGLTEDDKKHGMILACQAKTTKNLQVEEP
jgi:ferredoxin